MVAQQGGLIVEISSGASLRYAYNVPYGVGKAGQDRLAADMAHELQSHNIASVALRPGLTKTEWVAGQLQSQVLDSSSLPMERAASAQFTGRAVAALAADPNIMEKTGRSLGIFEVAEEYDVTDIDGSRPQPFRPMDYASSPEQQVAQ